jgi:O-antigen biosynthesis protein
MGARVPLSALRSRLDAASEHAHWTLHPDGVLGRGLMMPASAQTTFPLVLDTDARLTGRAMLLPHDWLDGRGHVQATITTTDTHGHTHELWSATLRAGDRGRPRGHAIDCTIPTSTTALTLSLTTGPSQHRAVTRMIWLDPAITTPDSAPTSTPPASTPPAPPTHTTGPLISVLTPVHDPPLHMLQEAIASVTNQTFENWELQLVDDGSRDPTIIAALQHHAATDPRIHLTRHDTAQGISAATNAALHAATGTYIATLDHDDTLTPDALQHVAATITAQPDLDMLYSDEDVVGEQGLIERHPKPGWSPEHMDALMYTCHLGVYRRSMANELGGFQTRYDGCQDYDFVLRLSERTDRIAHIPHVLYHWRAHASSTAGGDQAKPYAYLAQPGAIAEHLDRRRIDAAVQFGQFPGLHRIVHEVTPETTVDLVLAVSATDGLAEAAGSWLTQSHPTWRLVLAATASVHGAARAALADAGIDDDRMLLLDAGAVSSPALLAAALAAAAEQATAEHLVLMQAPAVGLTHDWLTRLIGYSNQPGIAAAGPVVLAPDGRIHHAGIAIPDGIPLHLHHGSPAAAAPPVVYNLSAVSGILATPRHTYRQLGGLHPQHHDLTLIDYCLRAGDHHHRTVIVPDARLRTTGPDPTTNDLPALRQLHHTWATTHTHDPYYNPNYRTDRGDFELARG